MNDCASTIYGTIYGTIAENLDPEHLNENKYLFKYGLKSLQALSLPNANNAFIVRSEITVMLCVSSPA